MLRDLIRHLANFSSSRLVKTGVAGHPNVVQSRQGRYFVGRTGLLRVPGGHEAVALLRMPPGSAKRAFVVSITVTSDLGRRAYFYFGPETRTPLRQSSKIAIAHRGLPCQPRTIVQMGTAPEVPLSAGVGVFERLLQGGDTLVLEQQGRIVLEPGEGIGVRFDRVNTDDEIDVAFGWWEEPLGKQP